MSGTLQTGGHRLPTQVATFPCHTRLQLTSIESQDGDSNLRPLDQASWFKTNCCNVWYIRYNHISCRTQSIQMLQFQPWNFQMVMWSKRVLPSASCWLNIMDASCQNMIGRVIMSEYNKSQVTQKRYYPFKKYVEYIFFSWMSEHDVTFYSETLIGCPDHCKFCFCWRLFETV